MKRLIFLLLLLPSIVKAQISVYGGDSELKGLLGMEAQYHHLSISGGWRPNKIILGDKFDSYSAALTYYQPIQDKLFYASAGLTTKGITHIESSNYVSEPSAIIIVGTRIFLRSIFPTVNERWKTDWGVGINTTGKRILFTFEVLINFSVIKY
jgi:hypothetical protein